MIDDIINVLLVEDNPGDARLIVELLKKSENSDYTVTTAEDLSSAIILFTGHKFDTIILDLNLPDSNGLATLDSVIEKTGCLVPVIILTGINDDKTGLSAIGRGADDYLVKGELNHSLIARSIRYAIERKKLNSDIMENREIFRCFMENSPIYLFFKDTRLRPVQLSRNYETLLGKPMKELLGKTMDELFPSDLAKKMMEEDTQILNTGIKSSIVEELNGRFYETTKFPIQIGGAAKYLAGYTIDITELKVIMDDLRESREIYRTFIDASDDRIFLKDDRFCNIMINKRNAEALGKSFEEIIGKTDFELLPYDTAFLCRESDKFALSRNGIVKSEENRNGKIYESRKFPVKFSNGKTGVGGYISDITEQRRSEEALILRSTAMENAANAIIITDARGIIIWANPAFEYLTGYSFEEVSGHNPREIIKSGKHDRIFYMNMWDTIMSGKVWKGEIINRRKDGTLYTEEMTIAPVKDKNGEILNYVAIKQDITERNLAIKILKDSLSEKRELIREIYHRTKNNMQVIISMFSLQSMLDDDEKVAKVLRDMENRIRTMALVHEKLYQSRDLSKLDLKDYLLELINNIITGYITDRKKIVIKEKMENLEVLIDTATTCGLVVNELVTNAAKYAFPGIENGELKISLARDKAGEITLIIADNGCGAGLSIDLENTESMGIQIVKNIVEYQMKGNIKLDSSTGVKWTITFNDNVYNERV